MAAPTLTRCCKLRIGEAVDAAERETVACSGLLQLLGGDLTG